MKIGEMIRKGFNNYVGDVGIMVMHSGVGVEIECENARHPLQVDGWNDVGEAMLINGREYVLWEPLSGQALVDAVTNMCNAFKKEKFTQRCSTHIHIDVRDLTEVQMFNMITYYVIFERILLDFIAPERNGNVFCLPLYDAIGTEEILIRMSGDKGAFKRIRLDEAKYGSINLASPARLGSLEFRALEGTKDPVRLLNWINLHLCLKKAALVEGLTPDQIVLNMSVEGPEAMLRGVFGVKAGLLNINNLEERMFEGVRNAQYFAFNGDWND